MSEKEMQRIRGRRIAMVFQEPAKHLNPALTVGSVICEVLRHHTGLTRAGARRRAEDLMDRVEMERTTLDTYPHQLSGGMQQRALIALAIACEPDLLLADEPTTALDATVQGQILSLLDRLRREIGMGVLLVSHDIGVVQQVADRVSVIYAGRIAEYSEATELFAHPIHPYTELLLRAVPSPASRGERLDAIPGRAPDAGTIPPGCAFHPRCPIAEAVCREQDPELAEHRPRHQAACHRAGSFILAQEGV
jgi:oligopeptide/dipeptide ABC transporter ATP-binding protein